MQDVCFCVLCCKQRSLVTCNLVECCGYQGFCLGNLRYAKQAGGCTAYEGNCLLAVTSAAFCAGTAAWVLEALQTFCRLQLWQGCEAAVWYKWHVAQLTRWPSLRMAGCMHAGRSPWTACCTCLACVAAWACSHNRDLLRLVNAWLDMCAIRSPAQQCRCSEC